MAKRKEITIRNPFRSVANRLIKNDGDAILMTSVAVGVTLAFGSLVALDSETIKRDGLNDKVGTVKDQQQLVAKFSERIDDLKKQKIEIKKIEAATEIAEGFGTELSPEERKELEQLKEAFTSAKKSTLTDMHVTGISEEGVGLSEENFAKLYKDILQFVDVENNKIKDTNFTTNIRHAVFMLDETAAEILSEGKITNKDSLALAINKELGAISDKALVTYAAAAFTGLLGGGLGTIFLLNTFARYFRDGPEKIKIKLGKKRLPTNC